MNWDPSLLGLSELEVKSQALSVDLGDSVQKSEHSSFCLHKLEAKFDVLSTRENESANPKLSPLDLNLSVWQFWALSTDLNESEQKPGPCWELVSQESGEKLELAQMSLQRS